MSRILIQIFSASLLLVISLGSCSKDNGNSNKEAGEKFLEENGKRTGVITTASGLQYEILVAGTGSVPNIASNVRVRYTGTLINGTVFDTTNSGSAVLSVGGVIKGWQEVLKMMPSGSKWKIYLPYSLGYGATARDKIPAYSALIFEIELLGIA